MKKTLGIVGGLGPMATVYYMELITKMTAVSVEQEHLNILLKSVPDTPDRTAYILGKSVENPMPKLVSAARQLEQMGAEIIAIPCVTAQFFYHEIQAELQVPVLSMCDRLVDDVKKQNVQSVGIMATTGTVQSKVLERAFQDKGIQVVTPQEKYQEMVMNIIYQQIKQGNPIQWDMAEAIQNHLFEQKVERIILGCTELSLLKKERELDARIIDPLEVLARDAIIECGASVREEYLSS